ncbi:hypothetical protein ACFLSX_04810 [Calditrichota bacterium]
MSKETFAWKITIIILGLIGLSTGVVKFNSFWTSYVLDIVGPAWNYILFRGLYSSKQSGFLSINFTPESALITILGICFIIETSQYFNIYNATFDSYDYLAYISVIVPIYLIDRRILRKRKKST